MRSASRALQAARAAERAAWVRRVAARLREHGAELEDLAAACGIGVVRARVLLGRALGEGARRCSECGAPGHYRTSCRRRRWAAAAGRKA